MAKTTINGRIQDIKDVETRVHNDKTYYTRKMIVTEIDEQYPQTYMLEFSGPTLCDSLERYKIGQDVTCECSINGRTYADKNTGEAHVFMSIRCFKIEAIGGQYQNTPSIAQQRAANQQEYRQQEYGQQAPPQSPPPDDLPF